MDGMNNNDAMNPSVSNRKTQTFNLIIGIATLLIALLGATFAYFTATARSAEGEVTVKSAMVSIKFDHGTAIKASNLIPSSQTVAISKFKKPQTPFIPTEEVTYMDDFDEFLEGEDTTTGLQDYLDRRCVDSQGKEVCYVFWFSVTSDADADDTTDILASIQVTRNEFENLSYLVYEVEYQRDDEGNIVNDKYGFGVVNNYTLVSSFKPDPTAPIQEEYPFAKFGKIDNVYKDEVLTDTIFPVACLFGETDDADTKEKDDTSRCVTYPITNGVEHNYQILIWLEEMGYDQAEQGKVFNGTVSVEVKGETDSSGYNSGRITGRE